MSKRIILNASPKSEAKKIAKKKAMAKKDLKKQPYNVFTVEESYKRMTPTQQMIMKHPAADIIMVTGKEYGKGFMIASKMIAYMEQDYRASAFALKKYKTNAADRLHITFQNTVNKIKMAGYSVPDYEKGQNKTYRMKNKIKLNNQSIEYAGFDDYNSITGAEAYNVGYFPMCFFDEPSQMDDDPAKVPTKETWDMKISAMKSSISRSNTDHMVAFKRVVPDTQYYYALNPWDDHPLIVETEKHIKELDFFNYVKIDFFANHTMWHYDEENDKLYVRGTMFANPIVNLIEKIFVKYDIKNYVDFNEKKDEIDFSDDECKIYFINSMTLNSYLKKRNGVPIYIQAERAINKKDNAKLAEILGLRYVGKSKYKPVYDLTNLKTMNTDLILKNMNNCSNQFLGWDIDQRKGGRFVGTPVWVSYKHIKDKTYKNIVIGKQKEIKSFGVDELGRQIPMYVEKMTNASRDIDQKFRTKTMKNTTITMDDNSRHYISGVYKNLKHIKFTSTKFKTAKAWLIKKRQVWVQSGIDFGYIIIDEDNIGLIKDLQISVSKEGQKQRDESGGKAAFYDRINSMEYPLYYLRGELVANYPPGSIEMYMDEVVEEEKVEETQEVLEDDNKYVESLDDLLEIIRDAIENKGDSHD